MNRFKIGAILWKQSVEFVDNMRCSSGFQRSLEYIRKKYRIMKNSSWGRFSKNTIFQRNKWNIFLKLLFQTWTNISLKLRMIVGLIHIRNVKFNLLSMIPNNLHFQTRKYPKTKRISFESNVSQKLKEW